MRVIRIEKIGGNPIPVLNPVFWVDAAQNVTESGGAVSAWGNLGTGSTDATQGSGSAQPTYNATGFGANSLPYIDFNGSTNYFTLGTEYSKLAEHTVITVSEIVDASTRQYILGDSSSAGASATCSAVHGINGSSFENIYGNSISTFRKVTSVESIPSATPLMLSDTYTNGDTKTEMYLNGIGLTESTAGSAAAISGTKYEMRVGEIGAGGYNPFEGKIAEVIIFDYPLATIDLTAVHNFLISKYGL